MRVKQSGDQVGIFDWLSLSLVTPPFESTAHWVEVKARGIPPPENQAVSGMASAATGRSRPWGLPPEIRLIHSGFPSRPAAAVPVEHHGMNAGLIPQPRGWSAETGLRGVTWGGWSRSGDETFPLIEAVRTASIFVRPV